MVLCSIHLISLTPHTSVSAFLSSLRGAGITAIAQARVLRWMILPSQISAGHLLARNIRWDLLLILDSDSLIPASLRDSAIAAQWSAQVGTSSKMLAGYRDLNAALLDPADPGSVPQARLDLQAARKADSSQNLELTPEMAQFIADLTERLQKPVSMLNLLAFAPGKKESYVRYGQEFSRRVGSRHGGHVKIVGRVTGSGPGRGVQGEGMGAEGWDEIAFVHYPSIAHFASMAGDKDYQDVNQKYRLPALKDTFIICTMEVDDNGEFVGTQKHGARL
ncbi:hypothetical protein F5Y15DRAFT_256927 [Xylariaceae sp. FL0016]|nr:hypothetical protein F5Y15DRAFT_256927 [Xylariaceae sp. FL0016]